MQTSFILMGVSGSGKTTAGKLLAEKTAMPFFDADDYHPPGNIKKMETGIPLDDIDRAPWLKQLNELMKNELNRNNLVLACSALTENYRQMLSEGIEDRCKFIYLAGDFETIANRLNKRNDHFMRPELLQSQFDTLEKPSRALTVDIKDSPELMVASIMHYFQLKSK